MTKEEAYNAMQEGLCISHKDFNESEFLYMDETYIIKDEKGLKMKAILNPNIEEHKSIYEVIKSGLLDKMSFAFTTRGEEYDYETDTRTIKKIGKVFDVSVVDQPFYNDTDVSLASKNDDFMARREELRKQYELEQEEKAKKEQLEKAKQELLSKLG